MMTVESQPADPCARLLLSPNSPARHIMLALLRPTLRSVPRLTRCIATSIADVPVVAPTDKIAFKAPAVDTTKGELGQVYLPDLREYPTFSVSIVRLFLAGAERGTCARVGCRALVPEEVSARRRDALAGPRELKLAAVERPASSYKVAEHDS